VVESVKMGSQGPDLSGRIGRVSAPLREQVLEVLRDAILSFRFKPGQRLIERELIDSTGVSRTTIREVIRELAAEGLVKTIPQKGAVVVAPSAEEAEELYELRGVLEGHLVKKFIENASDAEVVAVRKAFTQFEQTVERGGGTAAMLKLKDKLYELLAKGAGNRALQASLTQLHARVSLLRATSLSSSEERPRQAVAELRALVEAIEARDSRAAQRASARHVHNAAKAGIKGLGEAVPVP
jgi:GntR family transcriptional regulator, trigonelline degradation regulator